MAEKKAPVGRGPAMTIDEKLVRQLADILADTGLTEIEVEESGRRVRVSRAAPIAASPAQVVAAPAAAPAPAANPAAAPASAPEKSATDHANAIKSPMVGTVYLAPQPGAPPFVNVGSEVTDGTVCIIEAMKTMNPVAAPVAGRVAEILVRDGQPVEYGEPLMRIE